MENLVCFYFSEWFDYNVRARGWVEEERRDEEPGGSGRGLVGSSDRGKSSGCEIYTRDNKMEIISTNRISKFGTVHGPFSVFQVLIIW